MPKNQLRNDLLILAIITSALQVMVAKGHDGAVRCGTGRKLEPPELERVTQILHRICALFKNVEATLDTRMKVVDVAEVCTCPIHIGLLRQAGICTLSQLHDADPLLLRHILDEAEKQNGEVPQYELYGSLKYQTERLAKSLNAQSPLRASFSK